MPVSIDLSKGLDKAHEDKSLAEILDASPSALAGLTDAHAEALRQFGIMSVRDLGRNKYFAYAAALVELETKL